MKIEVGGIYIRHSDGQICRVKWADHTTVVLESEDGSHLRLTTIYGLEKAYTKREVEPDSKTSCKTTSGSVLDIPFH